MANQNMFFNWMLSTYRAEDKMKWSMPAMVPIDSPIGPGMLISAVVDTDNRTIKTEKRVKEQEKTLAVVEKDVSDMKRVVKNQKADGNGLERLAKDYVERNFSDQDDRGKAVQGTIRNSHDLLKASAEGMAEKLTSSELEQWPSVPDGLGKKCDQCIANLTGLLTISNTDTGILHRSVSDDIKILKEGIDKIYGAVVNLDENQMRIELEQQILKQEGQIRQAIAGLGARVLSMDGGLKGYVNSLDTYLAYFKYEEIEGKIPILESLKGYVAQAELALTPVTGIIPGGLLYEAVKILVSTDTTSRTNGLA